MLNGSFSYKENDNFIFYIRNLLWLLELLSWTLNTHGITIVRKTLAEVDQEGEILPDGTLTVYVAFTYQNWLSDKFVAYSHSLFLTGKLFFYCSNGQAVAVVYFRAGYTPADYPSESVSNQFVFLLLIHK